MVTQTVSMDWMKLGVTETQTASTDRVKSDVTEIRIASVDRVKLDWIKEPLDRVKYDVSIFLKTFTSGHYLIKNIEIDNVAYPACIHYVHYITSATGLFLSYYNVN